MMAPAFSSLSQAAAFAALLGACLGAPLVLRAAHQPTPEAAWSSVAANAGDFAHIRHEIFDEKGDIDLLFIGSSFLWAGIDTPQVERALSHQLGRKATVLTLGSNWWGEDLTYLLLRDLLAHRKVTLAVFSMPTKTDFQNAPHLSAAYRLNGDDPRIGDGLPLPQRLQLYGMEVLGAPRKLLSWLRPDLLEPSPYVAGLGAGRFRAALPGQHFVPVHQNVPTLPADEMIYSERTRAHFVFDGVPLTPYQDHFIRLRAELARKHGVHMAVVHIPQRTEGPLADVVEERVDWRQIFGADAAIIGVAPATLFAGMDRATIDAHYYNEHLNLNGAERLTRVLLPALLSVHAQSH
jgi:hypothetical protein